MGQLARRLAGALGLCAALAALPRSDERQPLPLITQVDDPVLAHIWDRQRIPLATLQTRATSGHLVEVGGRSYVFLTRELFGYGPTPWIIGTYYDQEQVERELLRLLQAALAGAAVLVVALLAAVAFARLLGRPILGLARSAEAIRNLDLGSASPLKRSIVRELDDAGRAFRISVAIRLQRKNGLHQECEALAVGGVERCAVIEQILGEFNHGPLDRVVEDAAHG